MLEKVDTRRNAQKLRGSIAFLCLALFAIMVALPGPVGDSESPESALAATLATIRPGIDLYRVQHACPSDASTWSEFVRQLTTVTNADGSAGTKFGPYLRGGKFPTNPITGRADGCVVWKMPDEPAGPQDWIYCRTSGEFRANLEGEGPSHTPYFDL